MNNLLQVAVNVHGGLERWNQLKTVKASVSITGAIWRVKGKPDVLQDISIEAELHKKRLTTHFHGQGKRTVFEPNRITVERESGRVVDSRDDPRSAFRGHSRETPWDDLHVAYFSGYALWNYLTIPHTASFGTKIDLDTRAFVMANMVDALVHAVVLRRPRGLSPARAKAESCKAILAYLAS